MCGGRNADRSFRNSGLRHFQRGKSQGSFVETARGARIDGELDSAVWQGEQRGEGGGEAAPQMAACLQAP